MGDKVKLCKDNDFIEKMFEFKLHVPPTVES